MRLVFVHGWGFDTSFWNPLRGYLEDVPQTWVDLGFFAARPDMPVFHEGDILVGHSLGFMWGMVQPHHWRGFIAINGFPRFSDAGTHKFCAPPAALRAMRNGLKKNPQQVLQNFYATIGATGTRGSPNIENLDAGLEILQNADVSLNLNIGKMHGLVLAGKKDPLIPAAVTEFLVAQSEGTIVEWHDDAGHLLPFEQPEWCAHHIRKHIHGIA